MRTKIFHLKTFKSQRGFTLMEVMVVLAIIAAIVTLIVPRVSNKNNQIKSEIRKLTTLTRQIRNLAKLQNSTYRLVIDMKDGANSEESHSYWIERAPGNKLISEDREDEYITRLEDQKDADDEDGEAPASADGFSADNSIIKEPKELVGDMIFEEVEIPGFNKPITAGKIYIHFFPSGRVEEAAIHLKLAEVQWTVAIHPLTGKSDIITEFVTLEEIKRQ